MRTIRQFQTLPSLPTRGPVPGIVSVIIPLDRTNLITNPSIELATTNYTAVGGSVARSAVDQYHGTSLVRDEQLVRIDAEFQSGGLLHFGADAAVGIDAVDGDARMRQVVRVEQKFRVGGKTAMHRARPERHRLAEV